MIPNGNVPSHEPAPIPLVQPVPVPTVFHFVRVPQEFCNGPEPIYQLVVSTVTGQMVVFLNDEMAESLTAILVQQRTGIVLPPR